MNKETEYEVLKTIANSTRDYYYGGPRSSMYESMRKINAGLLLLGLIREDTEADGRWDEYESTDTYLD